MTVKGTSEQFYITGWNNYK